VTAAVVSELIRAANEAPKLTKPERARLLERAAATIADYRDEISFSGTPANDHPGDIVRELRDVARLIDLFSAEEIARKLLDAAEIIKVCRVLLEAKREVEEGS
jgi:acyl-CoA reductase-like NAD-dependent aldehyde dehydrogenase